MSKEVAFRPNGREHRGNAPKVTSRRRALPVADTNGEKSSVSVPKKKSKSSGQAARHREERKAQLEAKRGELRERRLAEERDAVARKLAEKEIYMSRIAPKSDRDISSVPSAVQWSPESKRLRRQRAYTKYVVRLLFKRNRKPTHVPAWWDDSSVRNRAIHAAEVKVYP